jgi:hypothetical protein
MLSFEGFQNTPPPNMSCCHENYFQPKAFEFLNSLNYLEAETPTELEFSCHKSPKQSNSSEKYTLKQALSQD